MTVKIVCCKSASNIILLIPLNKFHMHVLKQLIALFLTPKKVHQNENWKIKLSKLWKER